MNTTLDERAIATGEPETGKPSRRWRLVAAGVVAVPLVAVAAAYGLFFTPDSPPQLHLSAQEEAVPGTEVAVPAGGWSVGRGSIAGYRVREKLLRLPASNDAVGRTSVVTGGFRMEPDRGGVVVKRGMRIDVDVSTLSSDEPRRDDHMRTMAIETDRFPRATFVSTTDLFVPASVATGGQAQVTALGDLTVHGVTRPVSIPLQAQRIGERIEVVGTFNFNWALFEMAQPNLSYVTVESDPTLELQLFFDHDSARTLQDLRSDDRPS